MRVIVNGEHREVNAGNVAALLDELDYQGHVAVAVNFDVVPRARWQDAPLNNGDAIEIISPRQGG
jgi:sulfur carrier protein